MLKKLLLTTSAFVVLSASLGSAALSASDDHKDKKDHMKSMDAHHAKMVKQTEKTFKERDRNNDGRVTHDEMSKNIKAALKKYDKNKDDALDYNELPKDISELKTLLQGDQGMKMRVMRDRMHEKMRIMMEEKDQKIRIERELRAERGDRVKHKKHSKKHRKVRKPMTRIQLINRLDHDRDEKISMDEMMTPAIRRFKHMDSNGDGAITLGEVTKRMNEHHAKMKQEMVKMSKRVKRYKH